MTENGPSGNNPTAITRITEVPPVVAANFGTDQERLDALFNAFLYAAESTGEFSWMGVSEQTSQLGFREFCIYVLKAGKPTHGKTADIGQTFDDLALALQPIANLDLAILEAEEFSTIEDARREIQTTNESAGISEERIVWEKALASPSQ